MKVPGNMLRNSIAVLRSMVSRFTRPVREGLSALHFLFFSGRSKSECRTALLTGRAADASCRFGWPNAQNGIPHTQTAGNDSRGIFMFKLLWLLTLPGLVNMALAAEQPYNPNAPVKLDKTVALKFSESVIGKQVGDHTLLDRNGHQVKLSSYLGKPLLVSFIYTGCSEVCPATTQFLAETVKQMQDAFGADSFAVLSVGFNSPWDSPQAMREFADRQRIELPNWEFLSADPATMKNFTRDLGFSYAYSVSGFDHITQLTVIDQQGKIYGQVYGDNFDLPFLAEPLNKLAGGAQNRYSTWESIGNRIRLFCSIYDPKTKTYRVDYLFFINLFFSLVMITYICRWIYREVRRAWSYGEATPVGRSEITAKKFQ